MTPTEPYLRISLLEQCLTLSTEADIPQARYPISTSIHGPGERQGSYRTPRGWHVIRARIGQGCPIDTVFRKRRPTGEIYDATLAARYPDRDWILTRILWLSGLEPGKNRYGEIDSLRRYIYIHGTPNSEPMGVPASHGCIRMRNTDIVGLFETVSPGIRVLISET